jgi:hypothetical protein
MEVLTGIREINMLIFNNLNIENLIILSHVNKKINDEVKDIILRYNICNIVIITLNEIRTKKVNCEESEDAEHLLLEMYYDMKKYNTL